MPPREEPASGYLLCGTEGEQQLYERDDEEARANASRRSGYTAEDCWFNVGDSVDVYRFEDLLRDYGHENVKHLTACGDTSHGCGTGP